MNFKLSTWIGQVTTGHGAMIIGSTLVATASGAMTWPTALPFLAAGAIGLFWPENTKLQDSAQHVAADVEAMIAAYRTGLRHGTAAGAPEMSPATGASPTVAAAVALLAVTGMALCACANQTPAQVAATQTAVASGLLCIADASGKIITTASTSDSNTVKAVNSAIAAGNVLLTDAACQTALANGVAALSQPAATAQP